MKRGRTEFGRRMLDARQHAKLTQVEAAKRIGFTQSTLSEAENTAQGSNYIIRISAVYSVSARWLETGEGQMLDRGDFFAPRPSPSADNLVTAFEKIPPGEDKEQAYAQAQDFFRRVAAAAIQRRQRPASSPMQVQIADQGTARDKSPS